DRNVTGVQTCALPICDAVIRKIVAHQKVLPGPMPPLIISPEARRIRGGLHVARYVLHRRTMSKTITLREANQAFSRCIREVEARSEERRVGKECRYRG